jgi:type II secretory pathway pseudopilin PulG
MTLVELLVSMTILFVVTTLIIVGWSSLQASYSSTIKGSEARDAARDAVSRMTREIRDMQPETSGGSPIVSASDDEITFYSAFNDAAAIDDPGTNGLTHVALVRYWYAYDASSEPAEWCIYRQRDVNGDGSFTAADPKLLVARNIVNGATLPGQSGPIPVFQYFDGGSANALSTPVSDVSAISTIEIHVVADLNPEHTPTYFDLVTTIKPRN